MGKKKTAAYKSVWRNAMISPRKARLVVDSVRGLSVNDALVQLRYIPRRACPMVAKVLRSAMANAQQAGNVAVDKLVVSEAYCDEGPTLKRWRPRAMGRAYPIKKRTTHISVVLRENEEQN